MIWISLPSLIFAKVPQLIHGIDRLLASWPLVIMPWLLFLISMGFFHIVIPRSLLTKKQRAALVLTAGLGNTSFVGIPMVESLLGKELIPAALILDQLGTFLVLAIVGIIYATVQQGSGRAHFSWSALIKKLFAFPPFVSVLTCLVLGALKLQLPEFASASFEKISNTLVPLALVSVGYQLVISTSLLKRNFKIVTIGLLFKLALAPLLFVFLYKFIMPADYSYFSLIILEAAMAPMITAGIVSEEFGFDAEISSLMVGVGIPISFLSVYLWHIVL